MPDPLDPVEAEMSLLAAALVDARVTELAQLTGSQFYSPARGEVWDTMRRHAAEGIEPDPAALATASRAAAELLPEIVTYPAVVRNAEHHAQTVMDRAERRRLRDALPVISERLNDLSRPVDDVLSFAEQSVAGSGGRMERAVSGLLSLREFLDAEQGPVEWVIPDVLAREDRVILTGSEGMGKTTLMRTIAVMAAAGLHPFTLRAATERRVLYVDCENPQRIMQDKFADLVRVASNRNRNPLDRLFVERWPEGMDLATPGHRMHLRSLCKAVQPDLLVIGPAYKLYVGGSNTREEDLARSVVSTLDGLREEFGFALILEHHMGNETEGRTRNPRPIGSSLWRRWPEFGIGLQATKDSTPEHRICDVVHWRGARDERPWPTQLTTGDPGGLPWVDTRSLARTYPA